MKYDNYSNLNRLFQERLSNSVALLEGSEEIVKYLHHKGYKIFVVTNGLIRLQKPRIANSSISNFLTDIIVSEEVEASKPNPKIFKVLMDRNKIKPDESIMIGDSLEKDILGAKNSNIKSIWYNPECSENNTDIIPTYEVRNLLDIKNIL